MIFITPVNDIEAHEESSTCKCCPKVIFENGEMIIIHNSFDGREALEVGSIIINNKDENN